VSPTSKTPADGLTERECIALLSDHPIGRLCVVVTGTPIAIPVNYRMVPTAKDRVVIGVRSLGNTTVASPVPASFQVDAIDMLTQIGWSVLAEGLLDDGTNQPVPEWLNEWESDGWLYITVSHLSGRRLDGAVTEWSLDLQVEL
jgi:Pyridoxamine 5'-phosphate oxidase